MTIHQKIAAMSYRIGREMDKFLPGCREIQKAEAHQAEIDRMLAASPALRDWWERTHPGEAIPAGDPKIQPWAQMDEGQRTDYLGERAADLADDPEARAAVHERMELDGVPDGRRREVTVTAREWQVTAAVADAEAAEGAREPSEQEIDTAEAAWEQRFADYWGSQGPDWEAAAEKATGPYPAEWPFERSCADPDADWGDGPAPDLPDRMANALDAEREAREIEAIEDETQPGGPLWNPQTGEPYDQATQERMIAEARDAQWASMADPALELPEREAADTEASGPPYPTREQRSDYVRERAMPVHADWKREPEHNVGSGREAGQ